MKVEDLKLNMALIHLIQLKLLNSNKVSIIKSEQLNTQHRKVHYIDKSILCKIQKKKKYK